jgi:hypothetical protein
MSGEIDGLTAALASGRERLLRAISGVSEDQFKKRPPAATDGTPAWCLAEILGHLLQQERLRAERIRLAIEQPEVVITPSTDDVHLEAARAGRGSPVPQLIHGLLASRREVERLLDQAATLDGGLDRAVIHPRLGRQTIAWIVHEKLIAHEAEHVTQIEAVKAALVAPTNG